jgi:hypothetical protein
MDGGHVANLAIEPLDVRFSSGPDALGGVAIEVPA